MSELKTSSELLPEVTEKIHLVTLKGLTADAIGQQHYGYVFAGSSDRDMVLKVTGWNFTTPTPQIIQCQPRQSENFDRGWSDQFGIQVIETGRDFVRIRIRRLDSNGGGWGQNLRIDMMVIE
ncbi:hypothetical protein F7734_14640 [Scytonema sp. UIC 10036]|uniref:hypothetical protein n=1 Tax=Scytonema sp. UIC 10036 TaxID=2304196 RepID=UPI0012DA1497|nr:hypothetical protein [Scytonema sp. UIC 10036]MUG93594.1 hypothetical protein [Scytonema sp. UIC 10036]